MKAETARHPRGLYPLFFTEMWERFSFYLLLGILYQYLTDSQKGGMGWTGPEAARLVGSYIALVYFTPFLGGLLADRVLGCRKTIVIGGVLMMTGHIVLAFPSEAALLIGLGCVILGNGAFKPNISTLVGNLYPSGSPLKDTGYNIFYMGINIGAFACNFIAAIVRNWFDDHPELGIAGWHAAFGTAGIGMLVGLIVFLSNHRLLARADVQVKDEKRESLRPLFVQCLGPAAALGALGYFLASAFTWRLGPQTTGFLFACIPVVYFYVRVWQGVPDPIERGRTAALLTIFGVVIVFWMVFHQNTTALNDWAVEDTDREPNTAVAALTRVVPDFAESAPPSYFHNTGPETPRPTESTFEVISDGEYEQLRAARALSVEQGRPVKVTREMLDQVYARTDRRTPRLPEGRHLAVVNAELFQSINPFFVILFTPMLIWFFALLRTRGREPSTSAKIGIGLLLTAAAPLIMLAAVIHSSDGATRASAWWLFGTYAVATVAELCLSPMGLSLVSKMSPARIRSFMMGGWFLSTSIGNKLSGVFGEVYHAWDHRLFFGVLAVCALVAGGVIFALLPWLTRRMPAVEAPVAEEAAQAAE